MSKENAKQFLDALAGSEALQKSLDALKPATPEELAAFAEKAGFRFTREEMKEALIGLGALVLSDEELGDIAGGVLPTPVNGQITDSITQTNTAVLGDAPAIAMGNLYQATAQALANAAHNATTAQQQSYVTMQAATTMGVATLYSIDTAGTEVATAKIFG
jgi:predicted ribosomally synthesized peptide with nif11-like leader